MSTLNVANITDGTDTVETGYVVNGSAKAWVNFNGNGTIAIRDSLNVASMTDQGVGEYQANYTSNMGNANYSASGFAGSDGEFLSIRNNVTSVTTSFIYVAQKNFNGSYLDDSLVQIMVVGDLA